MASTNTNANDEFRHEESMHGESTEGGFHSSAPVMNGPIVSVDSLLEETSEGKHMPKPSSVVTLKRMHADVEIASQAFSRLERYRSNMGKLIREVEKGMQEKFGMSQDSLHESAIRYQILDDTDLF